MVCTVLSLCNFPELAGKFDNWAPYFPFPERLLVTRFFKFTLQIGFYRCATIGYRHHCISKLWDIQSCKKGTGLASWRIYLHAKRGREEKGCEVGLTSMFARKSLGLKRQLHFFNSKYTKYISMSELVQKIDQILQNTRISEYQKYGTAFIKNKH